ncbi:MAG: hypothetical protein V8K32_07975 [Candidatus Electrothrix gigas]
MNEPATHHRLSIRLCGYDYAQAVGAAPCVRPVCPPFRDVPPGQARRPAPATLW